MDYECECDETFLEICVKNNCYRLYLENYNILIEEQPEYKKKSFV